MGIRVQWDDVAQRTIRYDFDEQWTWEDFFNAKKQAYGMIDTVARKVAVIMAAPGNMALPPNMLTHGLSALRNKHPNTLIVVFVITNSFLRTMLTTMSKVSRVAESSTRVVSTLEEARSLTGRRLSQIYDDDVTLPDR
ncbi:MAG: hypothetical protein ABI690_14750 [Chloroflexota bacterium]